MFVEDDTWPLCHSRFGGRTGRGRRDRRRRGVEDCDKYLMKESVSDINCNSCSCVEGRDGLQTEV
jgi:hypothetical protein